MNKFDGIRTAVTDLEGTLNERLDEIQDERFLTEFERELLEGIAVLLGGIKMLTRRLEEVENAI